MLAESAKEKKPSTKHVFTPHSSSSSPFVVKRVFERFQKPPQLPHLDLENRNFFASKSLKNQNYIGV